MRHPRDHEQPHGIGDLVLAHFLDDALVVVDGRHRRDHLVGPAVIHEQLSFVAQERAQVGIGGIEQAVVDAHRALVITVQVERAPIPVGILEDHVAELVEREVIRLRAARLRGPAQFAPTLQRAEDRFPGARVGGGRVNLANRLHLRRREAPRTIRPLTLQNFGVEGALDRELRAHSQEQTILKDALGFHLLFNQKPSTDVTNGRDVVLTIRRDVQYMLETMLQEGLQKYEASEGEAIIMDPKTGRILAMAATPSYDPAHFSNYDSGLYKNPALTDTYEPGSIFKILTVAAGIDTGAVKEDTQCTKCDGPRQINEYTLKTWNEQYHPNITVTDALAKSDNVAMIFVSELLGRDRFVDYIHRFGIGEPTHVELQEDTGTPLRKDWKPIDLATTSFGQGIVTNGLQMVRAVGAIANGGVMMRPTIISKVIDPTSGASVPVDPIIERQVVSPQTAQTVTDMMVHAAETGESKWAVSKTHLAATKTGTAQIPIAGHYDANKTIASFIGFAPPSNPKFVMLIKLREPKKSPWAAETAAPLWYAIAEKLYIMLNVPGDKN